MNAFLLENWQGNRTRYHPIALEGWNGTVITLVVMWFYLPGALFGRRFARRFRLACCFPSQSLHLWSLRSVRGRLERDTAGAAHVVSCPLFAELCRALQSFAEYKRLSGPQRAFRLAIFALAALMAFYANARLIFITWTSAKTVPGVWILLERPKGRCLGLALLLPLGFSGRITLVVVIDQMGQGHVLTRMSRIWAALRGAQTETSWRLAAYGFALSTA